MLSKQFTYEELEAEIYRLFAKISRLKDELHSIEVHRIPSELTKNMRDWNTVNNEIESTEKLLNDYNIQMLSTPKLIPSGSIKGSLTGRWIYQFSLREGMFTIRLTPEKHNWYSMEDMYTSGLRTEVITNSDNIPIALKRYLQNSNTKGYTWCYTYDVTLDIQPVLEEIQKPEEPKPIIPCSKVDEGMSLAGLNKPTIDKSMEILSLNISIDEQMKEYTCTNKDCNLKLPLGVFIRTLQCPNCGRVLDKESVEKVLDRKKVKK